MVVNEVGDSIEIEDQWYIFFPSSVELIKYIIYDVIIYLVFLSKLLQGTTLTLRLRGLAETDGKSKVRFDLVVIGEDD